VIHVPEAMAGIVVVVVVVDRGGFVVVVVEPLPAFVPVAVVSAPPVAGGADVEVVAG
jgi:hypothetical protein